MVLPVFFPLEIHFSPVALTIHSLMKCRLGILLLLVICQRSFSQTQTCPVNINFASGDLTHWYAYTGNNQGGNGPDAIKQKYDSNANYPVGTRNAKALSEYNLSSVQGMKVITSATNDPFGGFLTIPTINGYSYNYSIQIGSTAISRGNANGSGGGGYIRGISYEINVPPGPVSEPYTMTYAYAMVLENGTHISRQQPLISATLRAKDSVISCASPSYLLPTFDNVTNGGRGATLDSATAKRNGFTVSSHLSPNAGFDPNPNGGTVNLQDVWTKDWTEVTFDLSPYRGQKVSLTFEADNCVPGGHFAYGYVAIRDNCAGLMISGDSLVCFNTVVTYSVPALAGAKYNWIVPDSWTILSADTGNIIKVKPIAAGGLLGIREQNSCANLTDTIQIKTLPGPTGGVLEGSTVVCAGENSSPMNLINYSGNISGWLASADGSTWYAISNLTPQYLAENLNTTTFYKVVVEKGTVCPPDSSSVATIAVDQKTIGGKIDPAVSTLCTGQIAGETLTLSGNMGLVQNWQYSTDGLFWTDINPANNTTTNFVNGITQSTEYRSINRNGVCPPDTSSIAAVSFVPFAYPEASVSPADTTICFGTDALLNVNIGIGSGYTWSPFSLGGGNINNTPFSFVSQVFPAGTTDYILQVYNEGCPNPLLDTFHVAVLPKVVVDAGRDTSVVIGEPVQFNASSGDENTDAFFWSPATGLSDPSIANPVGTYNINDNVIKYTVKATTPFGCTGEGFITVKVFKTKPDIFVPNAFTPGLSTNTVFRPIPVGISSLHYFRIFNRHGQQVYNTTAIGNGWDGRLNGVPQASGGYVWMVEGTDYNGGIVTKKGIMVLIR